MERWKRQWKRMAGGALVLALAVWLVGCGDNSANQGANDGKLHVIATIAQIAEPVSVIAGERANVQSLMGPGVDPHLYNATQGDIRKLEGSQVILYNGLHLEANMLKVFEEMGKTRTVVAVGEAIPAGQLLKDETGAIDPHIWFDIDLWKQALEAATAALKKAAPADADYFENNKQAYFKKLDELKAASQAKLAQIPKAKRVLITAHDAFGYFGRLFDVDVVGLQGLSTESEVSLSEIEDTVKLLVQYKVPAVFVESSINPASINAVIEGAKKQNLDVKVGGELFSDAMGDAGTAEGTYLGMYHHNVITIHNALFGKGE